MKKTMKKLLPLFLAVVMSLAFAGAALAADYSITIDNRDNNSVSINGKTYSAYKVFDLTLGAQNEQGEYSAYAYSIKNTEWAWTTLTYGATTDSTTGVITTVYGIKLTPSASDATSYVVDGSTMTDDNARAFADALAKAGLLDAAAGSTTAASETATISLNEPGYYAVYGTAAPADSNGKEVVAALALTTTDPDATVKPKVEIPKLDKKITGQHVLDDAGKAATAQVGTSVSFQLDSNVPDLTGYSAYTFTITDTMTNGLTFVDPDGDATNDVKVTINDEDKTSEATVSIDGQKLTVTIPYNTLKAANKGDAIVVTYSAMINDNALTTDYEKNTAKLTYSNNPTTTTTNDTPDKEVYVIDVDINVNKVATTEGGAKLSGAEFKVFKGSTAPADSAEAWYKWDSGNNKVTWVSKADADTFTTNNEGKFDPSVKGLEAEKAGTAYGLLETKAPDGYNLLDKPIIVTLTGAYSESDGSKATVTAQGAAVTNGTVDLTEAQNENQPLATATVINKAGTELPSTGGIGTTIFYIAGSALVLVAGAALFARRVARKQS